MTISVKIKEFLDNNHVKYDVSPHRESFTAQRTAQCLHVSGKVMAKVVMVVADEKEVMTVMPACRKLDMTKFREIYGTENMRLAKEDDFKDKFPECSVGAMPPFGNLYNIDVYVDATLADDEYIVIPSGNYTESIRLKYQDFANLVKPIEESFSLLAA